MTFPQLILHTCQVITICMTAWFSLIMIYVKNKIIFFYSRSGSRIAAQNGANKKKLAPKATLTIPTSPQPPAAAPLPPSSPLPSPIPSTSHSVCASPSTPSASATRPTCFPATCLHRRPTTVAGRLSCRHPSDSTPRPVPSRRSWRTSRRRNGLSCPPRSSLRPRPFHPDRRGRRVLSRPPT